MVIYPDYILYKLHVLGRLINSKVMTPDYIFKGTILIAILAKYAKTADIGMSQFLIFNCFRNLRRLNS